MEEKRLECLMMLHIHRSDTPSIEADIDWFTTTAARRYMDHCTLYSTVDSFLNIDILNKNPVILEPYK